MCWAHKIKNQLINSISDELHINSQRHNYTTHTHNYRQQILQSNHTKNNFFLLDPKPKTLPKMSKNNAAVWHL